MDPRRDAGDPAAAPLRATLVETQLIDDRRTRAARRLDTRDRLVSGLGASAFLILAVCLVVLADQPSRAGAGVTAAIIVAYATLARVEFEVGSGTVVPTQLLLVPMLFVLPPSWVPLAVAGGLLLAGVVEQVRGGLHVERIVVTLYFALHSLGPAAVLTVAGVTTPSWSDWWLYVLALAAQFALDAASALIREVVALRVDVRVLFRVLPSVYAMDVLLSPVGVLAAVACASRPLAFLAVLPLGLLLHLAGIDRRARIDHAVELTGAYESASRAARTDGLTGLANRRAWEEHLLETVAPCAVVLVDVDDLKQANDAYGHDFGDRVIREVAALAASVLGRDGALVARIGGDELGALLTGVTSEQLSSMVGELRGALARHPGVGGLRLSASVGAASCPPEPNIAAAIETADRRVYAAKRGRRAAS